MRRSKLTIGPLDAPMYEFENNEIISIDGTMAVDIAGTELSADELSSEVVFKISMPEVLKPEDSDGIQTSDGLVFSGHYTTDLRKLPYGTEIHYYNDNELVGKFYSTTVIRTGVKEYQINAQSVIGVLEHEKFYGGYYKNKRFDSLIKEIILTDGLSMHRAYEYIETNGSYLSTTAGLAFCTEINMRFRYDGISNNATGTSNTVYFFGEETQNEYFDINFAVKADIVRETESEEWNNSLQLELVYKDITVSGPIVEPGTMLDITVKVDGENSLFKVNEQTTEFSTEDTRIDLLNTGILGLNKYTESRRELIPGYLIGRFYSYEYRNGNRVSGHYIPADYKSTNEFCILNTVTLSGSEIEDGNIVKEQIEADIPGFINSSSLEKEIYQSIEIDEGIENIRVYGWIPVCSKREAIYNLLFSQGISLIKGTNGGILLTFLKNSKEIQIHANDIVGDSGKIEYLNSTYQIDVTEHGYTPPETEQEQKTVFDNTDGLDLNKQIIEFSNMQGPLYGNLIRQTAGITAYLYNANAAIVSGIGSLAGKEYNHSRIIISRKISENPDGGTISVSECGLITLENSEQVADRLYEYYRSAIRISNEIKLTNQFCGRFYQFLNPFRETEKGYLSKIDVKVSAIMIAQCEFICGYKPVAPGGNYSNGILLTGSGTWNVPAEVFEKEYPRIRVTLISGGAGGYSGYAGEDGEQPTGFSTIPLSDGGAGGNPGAGGRVNVLTIENPAASYSFSCGEGGEGGEISTDHEESNEGTEGTDTTFSDGVNVYTTEGYTPNEKGVRNFFSGETYGKSENIKDVSGIKGSKGTSLEVTEGRSYTGYYDENDWTVELIHNEKWKIFFCGLFGGQPYPRTGEVAAAQGSAGGAAAGENGNAGEDASSSHSGNGGNGGNAILIPEQAGLGNGGLGGFGGGAGGASGFVAPGSSIPVGTPGTGGYGGKGGKGGNGCIIIYF